MLGVPLAGTIGVVTFVTAYVPYVGAFVAGAFAVLIALGAKGTTVALIMLVVVILANGLLQNIVQPFAMGSALDLHPLAVLVLTIGAGCVFGMLGLVLAAPLASAVVHIMRDLARARAAAAVEEGGSEPAPKRRRRRRSCPPSLASSGSDDAVCQGRRDDREELRKGADVNDDLGGKFWLKLIGLVIVFGIAALLLFLLVDAAWYRWGIFGALLFFFVILLAFGWFYDRRKAKSTRTWTLRLRRRQTERRRRSPSAPSAFDEAELARPGDRVAAARDAELAVDGDRLGLDRVARDEQPLADLAEREVGREQRQQPQLGRASGPSPPPAGLPASPRSRLRARDLLAEARRARVAARRISRASSSSARAALCVAQRHVGAAELEPHLHGEPGDRVGQAGREPLRDRQLPARFVPAAVPQERAGRGGEIEGARRVAVELALLDQARAPRAPAPRRRRRRARRRAASAR